MIAPRSRALVLGATGHIGNAVVRELLAHGYAVTAVSRQRAPAALEGLDVTIECGDIDHDGMLAMCVHGHDVVIDAAAPYPVNRFVATTEAERAPLAHARRRMGALLDAVAREEAVLGYVSSFTTLPRPEPHRSSAALETRIRRAMHPYFAVKEEMERMVCEAARRGVQAVIVNPTAALGPYDRRPLTQCAIPLLVREAVPVVVRRPVNVIDVRDIATALRGAIECRRFGTPIALSGHDCRTDELAQRVCALARVRAPEFRTSSRAVAAGAIWGEMAWATLGRPSPLPVLGQLLVLEGYPMPPSAEQRALGAVPRPLDETLLDSIAWYRALGYC